MNITRRRMLGAIAATPMLSLFAGKSIAEANPLEPLEEWELITGAEHDFKIQLWHSGKLSVFYGPKRMRLKDISRAGWREYRVDRSSIRLRHRKPEEIDVDWYAISETIRR